MGSFTLTIQRELDRGFTYVKCNGSMAVWFNIDPAMVELGYLTYSATGDWICDVQLGGTGSSGITSITTCDAPITYKVDGKFKPAPDCSLTLEVTEITENSQMNCVNNILGPLPMDTASLAPDEVTVFPTFTFLFPDTTEQVPGDVVSKFTVSDIVVNKETGCTFVNP